VKPISTARIQVVDTDVNRGAAPTRTGSSLPTPSEMPLEFLPQIFENYVTAQCANDGNYEVGAREDLLNRECQGLSVAIRTRKLPHQKIGIEQEDYETDFNN